MISHHPRNSRKRRIEAGWRISRQVSSLYKGVPSESMAKCQWDLGISEGRPSRCSIRYGGGKRDGVGPDGHGLGSAVRAPAAVAPCFLVRHRLSGSQRYSLSRLTTRLSKRTGIDGNAHDTTRSIRTSPRNNRRGHRPLFCGQEDPHHMFFGLQSLGLQNSQAPLFNTHFD